MKHILGLKLGETQTGEEVIKFVSMIETFYCDKVAHLNNKQKESAKKALKIRGQNSVIIDKKGELESILLDSLQQVRINIHQRKQKTKREHSQPRRQKDLENG
mgnify:CR=1 FL=1|tara:strand:- start:297 stop:605 length:309 start_codon:yes stop_codon:yes gene_type:complete